MSPPDPSANSNIRVFVRWQDHVVFAGEEVKCTITFKNVARPPGPPPTTPTKNPHPSPRHLGAAAEQRLRQPSPLGPGHPVQSPATQGGGNARTKAHGHSVDGLAPPPSVRGRGHGHRSTLSLTVPSAAATSRARDSNSLPWSPIQNPGSSSSRGGPPLSSSPAARSNGNAGHGHKRSVSIVSLGSTKGIDEVPELSSSPVKPQRPGRGHARASSLQIIPRVPFFGGPKSATHPKVQTSQQQPSPLFHASYPPNRNTLHSPTEGPLTPSERTRSIFPWATSPSPKASPRADQNSEFRFPFTKSSSSPDVVHGGSPAGPVHEDNIMSPTYSVAGESVRSLPMRSRDQIPTINEHGAIPSARILSTTSIGGTPRSSGEFYSMSNHSSETLASEYVQSQPLRMAGGRSGHSRRPSSFSPNTAKLPESLMMGYAQIQGSFTLDGSLVNLGPFEQVKRKAVVGGHGGGVIGVETTKRDSGLLRGFGWGSITSSIGELLGGGELSTIKEMRGIASSKSIPLLSTPQSILFVDLQLAPGESKTFEYSFKLPKGLPPTHRGKAMKISYSLVIGTQRPGGAKDKHVKSVDVPFRVLGSVNNHGEILGHDLMAPYIILRDQARVQTVNNTNTASTTTLNNHNHQQQQPQQTRQKLLGDKPAANEDSFLTYVDELLSSRSLQLQNGARAPGLLSPTASAPPSRRPSNYSLNSTTSSHFNPFGPQTHMPILTAKEAIDLAILRSNIASHDSNQSTNRFEIARNGRRVAVVMLARPAYRLGEQITMAIDFEGAEIPCYAVHIALETAERVDSSLALRSEASVHRVTRKVLVSSSEATMFAKRVVFTPTIPVTATPEFVTSGVSLEWKVRVEFVVPSAEALERMGQSLVLGQASSQGQSQSQGIGMGLGITNNGEEEYEIVSDNEGGRNGVIEEVDEEETDNEEDEEEERETRLVKTNGSANPNKGKEKSRSRPPMLRKNQTLSERERERERNLMQLQAQQQQQQQPHPLLEEISRDDRGGLVLVAAENLICESFEVAVPLKIYGAVGTGLEKLERDEVTEEGLPV